MGDLGLEEQGVPKHQVMGLVTHHVLDFPLQAVYQFVASVYDCLTTAVGTRLQGHDKRLQSPVFQAGTQAL